MFWMIPKKKKVGNRLLPKDHLPTVTQLLQDMDDLDAAYNKDTDDETG